MVLWIFSTKLVKIAAHFLDHPSDLRWLPAYFAFVYWHSFVKLWCAITFWDHTWNGRDLKVVQVDSVENLSPGELTHKKLQRSMPARGITGLWKKERDD